MQAICTLGRQGDLDIIATGQRKSSCHQLDTSSGLIHRGGDEADLIGRLCKCFARASLTHDELFYRRLDREFERGEMGTEFLLKLAIDAVRCLADNLRRNLCGRTLYDNIRGLK